MEEELNLDCIFCDENVVSECLEKHAKGVAAYAAYRACIDVRSTTDCLNDGTTLDPCVSCWHTRCADEYADWRSRPEEERRLACVAECDDSGCEDACNDAGATPPVFGPFSLCIETRCADVCAE